jgi:hypothetical protein
MRLRAASAAASASRKSGANRLPVFLPFSLESDIGPSDTSPEAQQFLIEGWRRMSRLRSSSV